MRIFTADRIFHTTEDGKYVSKDTVFAQVGTEYFIARFPGLEVGKAHSLMKGAWHRNMELFRDYWQFFCDSSQPMGPFFQDTLALPQKDIRIKQNDK